MSEPPGPGAAPFPPRLRPTVRVDSADEIAAFLTAYPARTGRWASISQTDLTAGGARRRSLVLRDGKGDEFGLTFELPASGGGDGSRPERPGPAGGVPTTEAVDALMRAAAEFAAANPPHHPGSVPRFPVPSVRYPGRVEVPLAVVAVDGRERGLFAPPRVVAVDYATAEPYGVGEFPGFDPDDWPPSRIGPWPPHGAQGLGPVQLQASLARLSACLVRLFGAWAGEDDYLHRSDDAGEVLLLQGRLDVPGMAPYYDRLNPPFRRWLAASAGDAAVGPDHRRWPSAGG